MTPPPAPRRVPMVAWLALAILALAVSCELGGRETWDDAFGPVVPHDSFPGDCSLCHETGSWQNLRADFAYDHEKETGVKLEAAHAKARCLRCHNDRGPVGMFAQRGCAGCHEDIHRGELGKRCESCHDDKRTDWRPVEQIAAHARTRMPLIGAHAATACWRCHPGAQVGNFKRTDIHCESCHQSELVRAVDPDHALQGWTKGCEECHRPTAWNQARFAHASWPLVGQHRTTPCSTCHVNNRFQGTPRNCVDCHLADYNRTTDPNHSTAGFSTDCAACHVPNGWTGANFQHNTWPLSGAHLGTSCNKCHVNNVYKGTPRNCIDCHLADYNGTTNPDHQALSFPTACDSCHSLSSWRGARFDHRFPITSGKHSNLQCTECHTTPNNYKAFECILCHEHTQTKANDQHKEMQNYLWSSPACYQCHPNGRKP